MRGGYAARIGISGIPIGVVNNLLALAAGGRTHAEGHTGRSCWPPMAGLLRAGCWRGVDGCFGDFAGHDAIVAQLRRVVFQADDRIIPQRVRRLGHICGARIRLGVGVAVHDTEHCETAIIGRLLDSHVVLGV